MNASTVIKTIQSKSDQNIAKQSQKFFKTGKGQYGEGDIFVGVRVPELRKIALAYKFLQLKELQVLLESSIHEVRQTALYILVLQYKKAKSNTQAKKEIYEFYLANLKQVNNWDLVDLSASEIVGSYLLEKNSPENLFKMAQSKNLWEQRIAVIATFAFIRAGNYKPTLTLAEMLLTHKHDLIHKAVGWTLRDIGKKDKNILINFLHKHYLIMPRTMLRYAIEKFPEDLRQDFLKGKI